MPIRGEGWIKGVGKRVRSRMSREKMVAWNEWSGKGGMEVFGYDIGMSRPALTRDTILHVIA